MRTINYTVTHSPRGTTVRCVMVEGPYKVSFTVKCYVTTISAGKRRASKGAREALRELTGVA